MPSSILLVHQGHELYGSDRTFLQSVRAVAARWPAAKITALLPREGELSNELLSFIHDVRIEDLGILRKSDLRTIRIRSLFGLIRKVNRARKMVLSYDVTYINTVVVMDYIVAAALVRKKSIVHVHEIPGRKAALVFSALISLSRASVVFNSHATAASFSLSTTQTSRVIWNGVALGLHDDGGRLDDDTLHILLLGRVNKWKGHRTLIEAIGLLAPFQKKRVKVKMAGGVFGKQSDLLAELERQIEQLQLGEYISIMPFCRDPHELYTWADVVAVPSIKPEPFGLVAIEAMAASRPVIAARHGGLAEVVQDGVTGMLVTPDTPQALADAISAYLNDPDRLRRDGVEGRRRFEQHFTEAAYMERIADAIEQTWLACEPTGKNDCQ